MPQNSLTLDNLKQLILIKTGLHLINPSDCKAISLSIQKELNKNISETTIKRFFGFASSKTNFSKFTINTLTEFVSTTTESYADGGKPITSNDIQKIILNTKQITNYTLKNIKSRCSVPYELTIARKFANHDFHYFYESDYSFTAFIAQPGYGKTILLSHLVEEVIANTDGKFANDVVCYFNVNTIFDQEKSHTTLEDNIKSKIGLSADTDLTGYFESHYQESKIRLILIFDGFSELILNRDSKIKIFDQIVDLISAIDNSSAIKIILSMRSTIWSRFFDRIRHTYFLKSKWFPGSYYYLDYNSNVPPLTEKELELVIEKINPGNFQNISPNLKSELKFPFHIQWYYKLKEKYPSFNSYTNVTFHEIISLFINEKIYKSNYATEKIFFFKQIIKHTNFSKKGNTLAKIDLILEIASYKNAYMELLADGILMEEKSTQTDITVELVRFVHPHIFEYFLFKELLELHQKNMDKAFFEHIQEEFMNHPVRFELLQWSIRHLIIQGKFIDIENVFMLDLTNYEKNYLIYFIAENLIYRCIDYPEIKDQIKAQNLHEILIRELVHFDFVDSCYQNAIDCLLEIVDNQEHATFYNSILAIIDCLSLDEDKIYKRLKKMEHLKSALSNTLISPYEIVNLIYLKLKGITVPANNDVLLKIHAFKNDDINLNEQSNELPSPKNILEISLIIVHNVFYGTQQDLISFAEKIFKNYPKLTKSKNSFSIFFLNLLAMGSARVNPGKKTDQMERIISRLYENKSKYKPTLYDQSLFLILRAQQSKNKKDYDNALSLTKEAITIFSRNNLTIHELLMYNLIISIFTETHDAESTYQYNYKKLQILEDKKLSFLSLGYIDFTASLP